MDKTTIMSFDKDYPNRKDNRQKYFKNPQIHDRSCRPGGDCPYCSSGRLHNSLVKEFDADDEIDEFLCDHEDIDNRLWRVEDKTQ